MFWKKIQIFTLIYSLAFTPTIFATNKADAGSVLGQSLLIKHTEIKTGSMALEMMRKLGPNLMDQTARYLQRLKPEELKKPANLELINHQTRLQNFLAVDAHFKKCVRKSEMNRNLDQRILAASLKVATSNQQNNEDHCLPVLQSFKDFNQMNQSIVLAMKATIRPNAIDDFSLKALENSARSLLSLQFKFSPNFKNKGQVDENDIANLIQLISVKNQGKPLNKNQLNILKKNLSHFANTQLINEKKYSIDSATENINKKIKELNASLATITLKNDRGFIFDSANLKDPEAYQKFEHYVQKYTQTVSSEAGVLMLTQTLKEKSGEIKRFEEDDTVKNRKKDVFHFNQHKLVQRSDVEKAYLEAEKKIIEGARELNHIKDRAKENQNQMQEDIEELVKINPLAIGQTLMEKPEYAGLVCDAINKIQAEDQSKNDRDKYFMIGGAVLGGALLLTGVGTALGAYMITGSLTAGVAAGTVGGSIISGTIVAGAALEATSLIHFGTRAIEYQNEANKFEIALLSGNTDAQSITEARDAIKNFKEAKFNAALSLAGLAASGIPLLKFLNLSRFQSKNLAELKAVTKILEHLNKSENIQKLKTTARLMGNMAQEKIDAFLLLLAKSSESLRIKTLESLQNSNLTPEKLKEIIEKSLFAAKNCAK